MEFAFFTLTLLLQILSPDGEVIENKFLIHPVPFLSKESCELTGEQWAVEVTKEPNRIAKFKCSPGINARR